MAIGRCSLNRDSALSHTAPPMVCLGVRLVARCCIIFDLRYDREWCPVAHANALEKARSLTTPGTHIYLMKARLLARTEHLVLHLVKVKLCLLVPSTQLRNVLDRITVRDACDRLCCAVIALACPRRTRIRESALGYFLLAKPHPRRCSCSSLDETIAIIDSHRSV